MQTHLTHGKLERGGQGRTPRFHSPAWRIGDAFVGALARLAIGPIHLLTTRGHRTGRPHTKPVVPVDHAGKRWLVAPYGPVAWVRNARATNTVALRYGRVNRPYVVREASAHEAGPVLKRYLQIATKVRSHFPVPVDSPVAEFIAVAPQYPVFELVPAPDAGRS
jgi:deazaflavin-dependent oxidoreductase (nitroreductase family)